MSTVKGRQAEERAHQWLSETKDWKLVQQNWKNKWCEIDLVMQDNEGVLHFIEVKYRGGSSSGHGYDYVPRSKQRQLARAVQEWQFEHSSEEAVQIDVVSVDGGMQCLLFENVIITG